MIIYVFVTSCMGFYLPEFKGKTEIISKFNQALEPSESAISETEKPMRNESEHKFSGRLI